MNLLEILKRDEVPQPWTEGEKIPWNDPDFSIRMLKEHLTQAHDLASRRSEIIDRHVDWIHGTVLASKPARVLDLGCGPGLYASRLAKLGHSCVGIDFSPASIDYARQYAAQHRLDCAYYLEDIRKADYAYGYHLVMFVFGEFNVFRPDDARKILKKAYDALIPGCKLILEVSTFQSVKEMGLSPDYWFTSQSGLFSTEPHLLLAENFWNEEQSIAIKRFYVIDAHTSVVRRMASSTQAYTLEQYQDLVTGAGFTDFKIFPSLFGEPNPEQPGLFVITAQKPG